MHLEHSRGELFMPNSHIKIHVGCTFSNCLTKIRTINRQKPDHGPTITFYLKSQEGIDPAEACAVLASMSGRRGFKLRGWVFQKQRKTNKIGNIITGHYFCKSPPACKILYVTVLILNREPNRHGPEHEPIRLFF